MKTCIKTLLITASMLAVMGSAQAEYSQDDPMSFRVVGTKNMYGKVAKNLAKMSPNAKVMPPLIGSNAILQALKSEEADVGVAQMDDLAKELDADSDFPVQILGELFSECAFVVYNKDGAVTQEDHLQKKGVSMNAGKHGSGSLTSWQYFGQLDKGYQQPSMEYFSNIVALSKLLSAKPKGKNKVDAVMWVARPDLGNKLLKVVNSKPSLKFMHFDDWSLNNKHPILGRPIYEFEKVIVNDSGWDTKVTVPCTKAVLVARTGISDELLTDLTTKVMSNLNTLIAK